MVDKSVKLDKLPKGRWLIERDLSLSGELASLFWVFAALVAIICSTSLATFYGLKTDVPGVSAISGMLVIGTFVSRGVIAVVHWFFAPKYVRVG